MARIPIDPRMRKLFALLLTATAGNLASAQTTGVTGINDYWITPGGLPNATSCAPLTINTPTTVNMNVSAAAGVPYAVFWSFCGCVPCNPVPAFGTSGCLGSPSTACPSSNQFLEVMLFSGCATIIVASVTNAAGMGVISLNVPLVSAPITLGSQAAFFGPATCVVTPFNVLMSPGWNVTFQ
jgi:hypothetical protein